MQADDVIGRSSFCPEVIATLRQAFDEAWESIAGNFGSDAPVMEAARDKLARALLSIASEQSRDVEEFKKAALVVMASQYRRA